jgi:lipoate-protein ligase A
MNTARLLLDPPARGATNMAVDEALLQSAAGRGEATLRFYTWQEATLSLGYFQGHAERQAHGASLACPLVRRATGGGAIVHHFELTYSFVAPLADRLSADAEALYYSFHETLIETLGVFGIEARLCDAPIIHERGQEPFLCFQRRAKGDVLCGDYKITGSAQRRHHGAVLQHGSVLLMQSPAATELPGVAELAGRVLSTPELITAWTPALAFRLGLQWEPGALSAEETASAARIEGEKFAASAWTERR